MKKIVILSPKHYEEALSEIFKGVNVPIFSKVDVEGHKGDKENADISNWFASEVTPVFSIMFFAFVNEHIAHKIMNAAENWNQKNIEEGQNRIHAFMTPVERSI